MKLTSKKKYIIIGDPSDKIKKMSFEEFETIFNNVLIMAFPIKQIPYEKDINIFEFIRYLLKPNKKMIHNILCLSLFTSIFSIITTFYYKYMIDEISKYSKKNLIIVFFIFSTIYILKIVSEYFRNIVLTYINQKIELTLTFDIFKKIINLPYRYYHNKQTGDIISKINDLDNIRDMISKVALTIFIDLPLAFVSLIILYIISSSLFKIGIIILVLYLIVLVGFRKIINDLITKIKNKKADYTSFMVDSIKGFESIKGSHIEGNIINKFEIKLVKYLKDIFKFQNVYFTQNLLKELINDIGFITIILFGSILVINNKMNIGTLLTFSSLLVYFLNPIKNIINLDNTVKESKIAFKRVLELIDYENKEIGFIEKFKGGDIIFKNVNFTFDDKNQILRNVNLNIKKGSKVMIVGKSGSGKSTLFKLLMKYYKIDNNKIFINDIDINNYTLSTINNSIIYISQNEILFNDTLYNNIVFDNNEKDKLLSIANICEINEILDSNLGFNMLIEENGFNLSGGQRQRIILARALMKKFNILIIDEGLNQIDTDLERRILKNIFEEYKDKTIIVISHRLDNLDLFDNLIKFDSGQVKDVKRNG